MKDIHTDAVQTGFRKVHELYSARRKRRRMTKGEAANCMASISGTTDYSGFGSSSFVIEAVVEDMAIKKKVLQEVEAKMPSSGIFATNTSALSVSELQSASARPERVVGLHFFNPVDRMQLVEIVRGEKTSAEVLEAATGLARKLGKIPVVVNDGPGFLVNRVLGPYLNEAVRLFEDGYSPKSIDAAIRGFGMPMGPFELIDEVGLDVGAKVGKILHEAFGERARPPALMARLNENADCLGKKTGKGFYIHQGKHKTPNPPIMKLGGTGGADFKPDEVDLWIRRLVYPMINEAALTLEEKIVERPSDVDLAMVMGTGFAPFRGGPLRYADALGLKHIVDALDGLREPRLAPSAFLKDLAARGGKFYELEPAASASESADKEKSLQSAGS